MKFLMCKITSVQYRMRGGQTGKQTSNSGWLQLERARSYAAYILSELVSGIITSTRRVYGAKGETFEPGHYMAPNMLELSGKTEAVLMHS